MLIAFDFDGTLSDSEMTVLLGEQAGVAEEIDDITRRAMNDELSYAESLYARAELLDGLPETDVEQFRAGAEALGVGEFVVHGQSGDVVYLPGDAGLLAQQDGHLRVRQRPVEVEGDEHTGPRWAGVTKRPVRRRSPGYPAGSAPVQSVHITSRLGNTTTLPTNA